jgi:hypothetical protein
MVIFFSNEHVTVRVRWKFVMGEFYAKIVNKINKNS